MSLLHFNEEPRPVGYSPCGKDFRRCNWTSSRHGVTCSACRIAMDRDDEIALLQRHIGQLEDENDFLRRELRDVEAHL